MGFDRDTTLRKAEKLLRQGRLDAAIVEYRTVIEELPSDWNTANTLGDLYVRAGQIDMAVAQYVRIADHLGTEGFLSKAAAVYKKVLKIKPDEEAALLQLGEISTRQGLLADAKAAFSNLAERRRVRGDRRGAAEARIRLGTLDANDFDARLAGARAAVEVGDASAAVAQLKELSSDLQERGREGEALSALREAAAIDPRDGEIRARLMRAYVASGDLARAREFATTSAQFREIADDLLRDGRENEGLAALVEAARLDPADTEARARLARAYITRGNMLQARTFLTREVASTDPELLWTLAEMDLREGRIEEGAAALQDALAVDPSRRDHLVTVGCSVAEVNVDAGFECIDLAVNTAIADDAWADAAAALNEFVSRVPNHVPALMRLVEICVDGGLEATMYSAQAQLADAYLVAGRGTEARVIAEDLVAREPWERANLERFRRALTLLGVPDVDAVIADRLSGQSPFTSTDLFVAAGDGQPGDAEGSAAIEHRQASAGPDAPSSVALAAIPTATAGVPDVTSVPRRVDRPSSSVRAATARRAQGEDEVFELAPDALDLGEILDDAGAGADADEEQSEPSQPAQEIDLTGVLHDLKSAVPQIMTPAPSARQKASKAADIEGVFKELRDEVTHQTSVEDAAQHYRLATTYAEMGMIDEAMRALEVAARSARCRFEASGMLARLCLQRGAPAQAIEWFERAAEAPAPNPDAGRALLYDLAATLEGQGETARALAVFLELQADAGDYRDLAARLERLAKVPM